MPDFDIMTLAKLQTLLGERAPERNRAVRLHEMEGYIPLSQLQRLLATPDDDYGDITVSGGAWTIDAGVVTSAKLNADVWSSNQTISGTWSVGNGTGGRIFNINGGAGTPRSLKWQSGGSDRWAMNADAAAESGGNAGSGFFLGAFDDAGVFLGIAYSVSRATQVVSFTYPPLIGGVSLAETIDDRVNALIVAGANITKTYDDVANTLTIAATGGGGGGGGGSPLTGWLA